MGDFHAPAKSTGSEAAIAQQWRDEGAASALDRCANLDLSEVRARRRRMHAREAGSWSPAPNQAGRGFAVDNQGDRKRAAGDSRAL
jgi:hypothetical protein